MNDRATDSQSKLNLPEIYWQPVCETSSVKPFVAPEETACHLINVPSTVTQWLSCIVGNVGVKQAVRLSNITVL